MKHAWEKKPKNFRCWKCGEESPVRHRRNCQSQLPPPPIRPTPTPRPLFPLGRLLITPGAQEVLEGHPATTQALLRRHVTGDWSEMAEEDQAENRFSVERRLRIFSAYTLADNTKLWIITEADRSATTILLPEEY